MGETGVQALESFDRKWSRTWTCASRSNSQKSPNRICLKRPVVFRRRKRANERPPVSRDVQAGDEFYAMGESLDHTTTLYTQRAVRHVEEQAALSVHPQYRLRDSTVRASENG